MWKKRYRWASKVSLHSILYQKLELRQVRLVGNSFSALWCKRFWIYGCVTLLNFWLEWTKYYMVVSNLCTTIGWIRRKRNVSRIFEEVNWCSGGTRSLDWFIRFGIIIILKNFQNVGEVNGFKYKIADVCEVKDVFLRNFLKFLNWLYRCLDLCRREKWLNIKN